MEMSDPKNIKINEEVLSQGSSAQGGMRPPSEDSTKLDLTSKKCFFFTYCITLSNKGMPAP